MKRQLTVKELKFTFGYMLDTIKNIQYTGNYVRDKYDEISALVDYIIDGIIEEYDVNPLNWYEPIKKFEEGEKW
jgi:hypothetical protein